MSSLCQKQTAAGVSFCVTFYASSVFQISWTTLILAPPEVGNSIDAKMSSLHHLGANPLGPLLVKKAAHNVMYPQFAKPATLPPKSLDKLDVAPD